MIAMELLNKQSWKLSDEDKEFILNNYNSYRTIDLAEMFNVHNSAITHVLNSSGIRKERVITKEIDGKERCIDKEELYKLIRAYEGKVNYAEMAEIVKEELGYEMTRMALGYHARKIGVKSYRTPKGIRRCSHRLYLDGNKNNFSLNNIIIVNDRVYQLMKRDLRSNIYIGDDLLTLIKIAELRSKTIDKKKELNDAGN